MSFKEISLFGSEFETSSDNSETKKLLDKLKDPKLAKTVKMSKSKSVPLEDKLAIIKSEVYRILGSYIDSTIVIRTEEDLIKYFDETINNKIIAIDTETNNTLDFIQCKLMGLCLYTPGQKNAYIPVNHINRFTEELLENQVTEEMIAKQLKRVNDSNIKTIFHNSTFDRNVIYSTCGVKMNIYWDTQPAAKVLNDNELKGLKIQYKLHINPEQDKYEIEHLFQGLPYAIFEPELFALYAATDAYMTYRLYEYQLNEFLKPENKDVYKLYKEIEVPILEVVSDMELQGVCVDTDYASKMSVEYHKRLDDVQDKINKELERLKTDIDMWKTTADATYHPKTKSKSGVGKSKVEKLSEPIDTGSPTQLAILLYDILKAPVIDDSKPRGTGEEILKELSKTIPICKLVLEKRGIEILLNTFIDKMPELVKEKTNRLHASFNTYGADTGRFSSSEPNLQNIPSHDKLIRMIFKASDNYSLVGCDYSAQEPRSLASFSNDAAMLKVYEEDKDLYAVIGSKCFHNTYEDNLEFNTITHALQPDGKERRSKAKTIQLAISYGMSAYSLAESLGCSVKEAQKIIDDFYKGFPGVKSFTEESQAMLKREGFVTDMWGRRRHLPDAQLPEFSITPLNDKTSFNPLLHSIQHQDDELNNKIEEYRKLLSAAKSNTRINALIQNASADGLAIVNNRSKINRALRQCLNARIQGTAASMTKKAMVMIAHDEELNKLGFRLLVTVHDEVFGEVPTENSEAAAKRLGEVMVEAAKEKCVCKFKCDGYAVKRWYEDEATASIKKDYNSMLKNLSEQDALNKIKEKYNMIQSKYIEQICNDTYECNTHEDI